MGVESDLQWCDALMVRGCGSSGNQVENRQDSYDDRRWIDLLYVMQPWERSCARSLGFLCANLHTGLDDALNQQIRLTSTFKFNFTDVNMRRGTGANVLFLAPPTHSDSRLSPACTSSLEVLFVPYAVALRRQSKVLACCIPS
jgi:hypothetical protein